MKIAKDVLIESFFFFLKKSPLPNPPPAVSLHGAEIHMIHTYRNVWLIHLSGINSSRWFAVWLCENQLHYYCWGVFFGKWDAAILLFRELCSYHMYITRYAAFR